MADLLWLQVCYYFGSQVINKGEFQLVDEYLDMIIKLAPKWMSPYYFGAVLLPLETREVDKSFYFIDKGISAFPMEWQLPFFKGMHYKLFKNDFISASRFIYQASLLPGAPGYLTNLSATLAVKGDQEKLARFYLENALRKIQHSRQRDLIQQKYSDLFDPKGVEHD